MLPLFVLNLEGAGAPPALIALPVSVMVRCSPLTGRSLSIATQNEQTAHAEQELTRTILV